jgi:hypothetical protein
MRKLDALTGCVLALAAARVAGGAAADLPGLWDMTDMRKVPLEVEKASTRKAPLFLPNVNDWVRDGDSWVALILAGADERVKCVVTGVSAGGAEGAASRSSQPLRWEPAEQRRLWLAAYDPIAYAPQTNAVVHRNIRRIVPTRRNARCQTVRRYFYSATRFA